jgi:ABC-type transport system involved in multi-copper enzyme maturation permease subunit
MKRINLVIGVIVGVLLASTIWIVFAPILWILGANDINKKTNEYINKLIFDEED